MKRVPRRIFTEEFKKEAVRLFKQQDLTLAEVSRNLDIAPKSLKTWVALYEAGTLKASIGVAKLTSDQLRIRELERELAIAREERDILKKPLCIQGVNATLKLMLYSKGVLYDQTNQKNIYRRRASSLLAIMAARSRLQ